MCEKHKGGQCEWTSEGLRQVWKEKEVLRSWDRVRISIALKKSLGGFKLERNGFLRNIFNINGVMDEEPETNRPWNAGHIYVQAKERLDCIKVTMVRVERCCIECRIQKWKQHSFQMARLY